LQTLSPTDAILLQITPHGNGISLPTGISPKEHQVNSGLIQTLENHVEGGTGYQRQRFFVEITRRGEASGHREYVGILEILPFSKPGQQCHVDWNNLVRLGLVSHSDDHFTVRDIRHVPRSVNKATQTLLMTLLMQPPASSDIYRVTHRTEIGRRFARCCIPEFVGHTRWHPFVNQPLPKMGIGLEAQRAVVYFAE
jgi:hypothetical protein